MNSPIEISGPLSLVIMALFVAWAVLMFFAPFFWYGAWYRAKQTHIEAEKIRSILEQTTGKTGVSAATSSSEPEYPAGGI